MLDNLHPAVRHLILLLAPVILAWASTEAVPALADALPQAAVLWSLVTQLLLAVTPLTRQYGVGATDI
jgi:hypothetical protein